MSAFLRCAVCLAVVVTCHGFVRPVEARQAQTRAVQLPAKTKHVDPTYPQTADQGLRNVAAVQIEITVAANGRVTDARVVRSTAPSLDEAALDAVRQWEYDGKGLTGSIVGIVMVDFRARNQPAAGALPAAPSSPGATGAPTSQASRQAQRDRALLDATTGRLGFAQQAVTALLALDPRDHQAHYARGLAYFVGNPKAAIQSFSEVVQLQPADVKGYRARAWSNLVAGNYTAATADFDRVLQLAPNEVDAYRGRGWSALHAGNHDAGIRDFTEHLRQSRLNSEVLALRGLAYYFAGRFPNARADFRVAMRVGRRPNGALTLNTLILDDWRRFQKLFAGLTTRLQKSPNDVELWLASGVLFYHAEGGGLGIGGSDPFSRALAIKPDDIDALLFRASSGFSRATAMADLTEIIRLRPDHGEAYFQRAILQALETRTLPAAVADCKKAMSLASGDARMIAACDRLELDQRIVEIRKEQEKLAAPQRARDRDMLAIMVTFLIFQELGRDRGDPVDNFLRTYSMMGLP
jgi:TonB family protein